MHTRPGSGNLASSPTGCLSYSILPTGQVSGSLKRCWGGITKMWLAPAQPGDGGVVGWALCIWFNCPNDQQLVADIFLLLRPLPLCPGESQGSLPSPGIDYFTHREGHIRRKVGSFGESTSLKKWESLWCSKVGHKSFEVLRGSFRSFSVFFFFFISYLFPLLLPCPTYFPF